MQPVGRRTELIWEGKYAANGKRVAPLRVQLPFQNVEMVNFTRLDCIAGSAALMRAALAQATHHAHHRSAHVAVWGHRHQRFGNGQAI